MHVIPLALLAVDPTVAFDLSSIMTESVSTVQTQLFMVLGIVVPAIAAVTAAVVGVRFGVKWLRSLGKG